ncbi:uncharacterized protein PHACADRAFT_263403 [Phanerochaete carnosa HHB-10118-sp]|uniref:Carbohydrate kinase PfkB domain-containing protein n=1 Tax=Phanerochaete carnosa (strain HHB-10118-sp) TaxID=650164 RepID=K5VJ64_PHACS|nr:uncharacterized protein PHACADRAFT_263403 [Phanerochaete carnosa HHB-10118-sp]EKM51343.1 hypothetical protein PHACADRAFT_263403 [Phanerochaete carnosa HHB-10118-sp]
MAPAMGKLRRDAPDPFSTQAGQHPLRVVACGTLFLTHTLSLASHPEPSAVVRAHSVEHARGGSANTCLSVLAQFPGVDAMLVAPLGGNEEGRMIVADLEREGVSTKFCKVWEQSGVPSAWVLHADDTDSRTVINNNPLPDITHEEFISLLGPLLVPENYTYHASAPHSPPAGNPSVPGTIGGPSVPRPSLSGASASAARMPLNSPAPLDWIHFEGRSVKTTLSNIVGVDGLARERKWRSHCVLSVDVSRRARQGIEALIPHADVVFLNKHYARAHSPHYASSPRAFLLSLTTIAPPHALLVAHWGSEGAAVLSVPTKEYFQSSGWVDPSVLATAPGPTPSATANPVQTPARQVGEVQSVRSGSDFWARGHHTESSSEFTANLRSSSSDAASPFLPTRGAGLPARRRRPRADSDSDDDSTDSGGTEVGRPAANAGAGSSTGGASAAVAKAVVDEVGAQDAFVAGMMYALSRRLLPGEPYTPSAVSRDAGGVTSVRGAEPDRDRDRGQWRLEECLRFATELAGRKARRKGWEGLGEEMAQAGWFEAT